MALAQNPDVPAVGENDGAPLPVDVPPSNRKVIHHASLSVDVDDFSEATRKVESLVGEHGGFIADSQIGGSAGSIRRGTWTIRVPVDHYRELVAALTDLGELKEQCESSEEVTAEYFDLEARVRNKQQEEQRLLKHLDETTRQLPEILTIERELSRVRSEVERLQGRLKLLADQTSLSTIDLTIKETEPFVPAVIPTFATRLEETFHGSLESLLGVIQGLTLIAAAMLPWLVTLFIVAGLPFVLSFVVRRWIGSSAH
ncbi:MAG: DUF4349 domain-containing protein [Planctomycetaceae bacterium]|nr:DUF4349 domain-containing protein [Planctomycetaceae bacterium]